MLRQAGAVEVVADELLRGGIPQAAGRGGPGADGGGEHPVAGPGAHVGAAGALGQRLDVGINDGGPDGPTALVEDLRTGDRAGEEVEGDLALRLLPPRLVEAADVEVEAHLGEGIVTGEQADLHVRARAEGRRGAAWQAAEAEGVGGHLEARGGDVAVAAEENRGDGLVTGGDGEAGVDALLADSGEGDGAVGGGLRVGRGGAE